MRATRLFTDFFNSEKTGGIILVACTLVSLLLANSVTASNYLQIWNYPLGDHTLTHWINDGLMTIFFLLVGLELEREVYAGELSSRKQATLPVIAALGGMLVPAGIFLLFNAGTDTQAGAGIPMATDIAFAIGILLLLGKRIPVSVKILLTALAVIDDLGAILVIAIFYTDTLAFNSLFIALGIMAFLFVLNRLKIYNLIPYLIGGFGMWYFMLQSGVHATLAGVLLAFVIPFGDGSKKSPSYILQRLLHKPVAFVILPLFALANTSIVIEHDWTSGLTNLNSIGIMAGLVIGKPLGIFLFSIIAIVAGIAAMPTGMRWKHILGIGFLGGIGFTMSIFITLLAFDELHHQQEAKIAILLASFISALAGLAWLTGATSRKTKSM